LICTEIAEIYTGAKDMNTFLIVTLLVIVAAEIFLIGFWVGSHTRWWQ
jgi:hypothetical protein